MRTFVVRQELVNDRYAQNGCRKIQDLILGACASKLRVPASLLPPWLQKGCRSEIEADKLRSYLRKYEYFQYPSVK